MIQRHVISSVKPFWGSIFGKLMGIYQWMNPWGERRVVVAVVGL
jgi:hypothetical protein